MLNKISIFFFLNIKKRLITLGSLIQEAVPQKGVSASKILKTAYNDDLRQPSMVLEICPMVSTISLDSICRKNHENRNKTVQEKYKGFRLKWKTIK